MLLFSYKLTHDTGFAPNPFFGQLTLATCKPGLRRNRQLGDWIAGFTSRRLVDDEPGQERLIFLMQVTGLVDQYQYFNHPDFQVKKTNLNAPEFIHHAGDNIYRPLNDHPQGPQDFEQVENPYHGPEAQDEDLSGRTVLVSANFCYFGSAALDVPADVRPTVPLGAARYGFLTRDEQRAAAFVNWVLENGQQGVVLAPPHKWPEDDNSWQNG